MSSSRRCSVKTCSRSCRALCNCCNESFCLDHLNEHHDQLNEPVTPLTDQFNRLTEQVQHLSFTETSFIQQLDQWRREAHRSIDQFHFDKLKEYSESFEERKEKQRMELQRIREDLREPIDQQDVSEDKVQSLQKILRNVQDEIHSLQNPHVVFTSLVVDGHWIDIPSTRLSKDVLPLSPPSHTIKREKNSSFSIAANAHSILLCQSSKLCLLNEQLKSLKEIPWTEDRILDVFFSKTLNRFVLITLERIYHLHEQTMTITQCPSFDEQIPKGQWYCGTSYNDSLFFSKSSAGSSLYQYRSVPTMELSKEWKSPLSCLENEFIDDLRSDEHYLALIILDEKNDETRLEVRSATTLTRQWTVKITSALRTYRLRCCSLFAEQWLITDGKTLVCYISMQMEYSSKKTNTNPNLDIVFNSIHVD